MSCEARVAFSFRQIVSYGKPLCLCLKTHPWVRLSNSYHWETRCCIFVDVVIEASLKFPFFSPHFQKSVEGDLADGNTTCDTDCFSFLIPKNNFSRLVLKKKIFYFFDNHQMFFWFTLNYIFYMIAKNLNSSIYTILCYLTFIYLIYLKHFQVLLLMCTFSAKWLHCDLQGETRAAFKR